MIEDKMWFSSVISKNITVLYIGSNIGVMWVSLFVEVN